ncbi:MAG TPA: Re/Si-specific NAD(P)(+) transhydrogenase subunit alpha [Casimicrobiaceae bacterium]|jgi:NAD(P) transhydrogenase subunit alpha|nr:Re/Si-specific NAD(P)(+) transhydrogenase subunit alpha [Casimicrobiaceae bacterium]
MIIGIPRETRAGETRVAATPETVKKLAASGKHPLVVEAGAGTMASIPDSEFAAAGAKIGSAAEAFGADIVLKVRGPTAAELPGLKRGALLIGLLNPFDAAAVAACAATGVSGFALEWLPRISRAQSMDVLSSQANIAGYKAVMIAADIYTRFMPMLMTAAGTVKAARVLILGVGVAGLQAIATAKRLGAVIEASDVRPSVKDQVESLGAKWVDVPYANDEERKIAEGVGGYARPMPPEWMARQAEIIHERCKSVDILITTALIPGRPAPKLIRADTVAAMKPGAVIVDLAVEQGGNVEGAELDQIVNKAGVKIVGFGNLPARVATDASALYARNVLNFLSLSLNPKSGEFAVPKDDEIVKATLVCENGAVVPRN